ncbi:hypothetical protein RGR602_PC01871 (plasmid) [Rhizobium gallicum bv. gallicum R602sp]|uniref:Uncharacterized protein n=1 Tax=Rhizobium gallicum bv. gallicum R602sp TaxID=1041138 RepID=A0A0B4XGM4_9HYPH|nr:hypothetical protein RGR602_PC01871 [Rhizobium gallicum bv. gallicum R602sp]
MLGVSFKESDLRLMSGAVQAWYRHFGLAPEPRYSAMLCSSVIDRFNQGHSSVEDLTAHLIALFDGPKSMERYTTSTKAH